MSAVLSARSALCRRTLPIYVARTFSTSHLLRNEVIPPVAGNATVVQQVQRPVGGIRGGIIGFLFGFSLAASFAAYNLLDEYKQASAALQASVEELKLSTEKVTEHVRRIEAVEKDLKVLEKSSASKEDIHKVRAEMKKLVDGLHVEFLDLRAHVWGMQQDLHSLSKKDATTVRI
ncbi:hypothetical protein BD626DRAFT_493189 [Schizophyllum amplum]|uniref:Uncharacterized protein n=1 Tax=Schizophyllum amplum TaxID=97359 RepID=A0A550CGI7_9AGAR|nr:hypothetical protein BD626DRAFT_493189 [Auriculariopsis ampla]